MTKDEALKMAMEAMERCVTTCFDQYAHEQVMSRPEHFVNQAIAAIKEALAQPEQEPVAWAYVNSDDECEQIEYCTESPLPEFVPLYASPPKREWKGLTDEEITEAFNKAMLKRTKDVSNAETNRLFVHCIEAKLKEKNI